MAQLPESESELVAGFATEYSGMRYAFFFLSEYANMFVVSAVAAAGFLGGWHSPIAGIMDSSAWGVFWMINKTGFLIFVMIITRHYYRIIMDFLQFEQLHYAVSFLVKLNAANLDLKSAFLQLHQPALQKESDKCDPHELSF